MALGAACVGAAWFYTGGPRPYGYVGLGEVSVFVFFGLVATVGTAYVQTEVLTALEVLAAVPVGLMAVALLVVNNLRDIPGDSVAGKRTLAVRIGPAATRRFYEACVLLAILLVIPIALIRPWALLGPRRPATGPCTSAVGGVGRRRAGAYPGPGGDRTGTTGSGGTAGHRAGPMNQTGVSQKRLRRLGVVRQNRVMASATSKGRSRGQAWPAPATTSKRAVGPMREAIRWAWSR